VSTAQESSQVSYEARDHVAILTLNHPERRNALSRAMLESLKAHLAAIGSDPGVKAVIIRAVGPVFSSGHDLRELMGASEEEVRSLFALCTEVMEAIRTLPKPVIAQVHGYAMAGGTELVAACDLVYVAHDATFSYPVVRIISPPDFQYHPWLVGMRNAMELVLTGDPITGDDAVRMGLANRAFPADELDERVLAIATRLAAVPAELLQINKRSVHRAMEIMGIRTALRAGSELQGLATHLESTKAMLAGDAIGAVKDASQ